MLLLAVWLINVVINVLHGLPGVNWDYRITYAGCGHVAPRVAVHNDTGHAGGGRTDGKDGLDYWSEYRLYLGFHTESMKRLKLTRGVVEPALPPACVRTKRSYGEERGREARMIEIG
jgi:hypothetical protein